MHPIPAVVLLPAPPAERLDRIVRRLDVLAYLILLTLAVSAITVIGTAAAVGYPGGEYDKIPVALAAIATMPMLLSGGVLSLVYGAAFTLSRAWRARRWRWRKLLAPAAGFVASFPVLFAVLMFAIFV